MSHPPTSHAAEEALTNLGLLRRRLLATTRPKWWQWGLALMLAIGYFYLRDVAPEAAEDLAFAVPVVLLGWVLLVRYVPSVAVWLGLRSRLDERVLSPAVRVGFRLAILLILVVSIGVFALIRRWLPQSGMPVWFVQHPWTTCGSIVAVLLMMLMLFLGWYQRALLARGLR